MKILNLSTRIKKNIVRINRYKQKQFKIKKKRTNKKNKNFINDNSTISQKIIF